MVRYRSWGRNGKVLGREQREEIFKSDHDLMVIQRHPRNAHPERIVFGLPHNYGKKEHHKEVEPVSFDRRASPLFIHVHQTSESDLPIAVLTLLPSRFLPEDQSKISVGGNPVDLNTAALWEPIENWLNRMKGETTTPHERKEPFGNALEVTHG
jgi:CRISPR-associated protein Cmr1